MPQIDRDISSLFSDQFVHWRFDDSFQPEDIKGPFFLADCPAVLKQRVMNEQPRESIDVLDIDDSRDPLLGFYDRDGLSWRFLYYDPDYALKKAWIEGEEVQFKSCDGSWCDASTPCWGEYEFRAKPKSSIKKSCDNCKWDYRACDLSNSEKGRHCLPCHDKSHWELYEHRKCLTCEWDWRGDHANDPDKYAKHCKDCGPDYMHYEHDDSQRSCFKCKHFDVVRCKGVECNSGHEHFEPAMPKEKEMQAACKKVVPFSNAQELAAFYNRRYLPTRLVLARAMPSIWIKSIDVPHRQRLITGYCDDEVSTEDGAYSMQELLEQFTFMDEKAIGKEAADVKA